MALFLMNDGEYQKLNREEFIEAAARLGVAVENSSAAGDSARQADQIVSCLIRDESTRPNAILVSPVREAALVGAAHRAARLGVGWVLLGRWNSFINDMREEFPRLPIFCVTADQVEIGRIQGRQILALMPNGGELVCICGPLGVSSVTRRLAGLREVLDKKSFHVYHVNSDWTTPGGTNAMNEWLQIFASGKLPDFGVAAHNDEMAMGAKHALVARARVESGFFAARVPLVGVDGAAGFGQRLIREKAISATVIVPPTAGRAIQEVAAMLRSGGSCPESEVVLAPSSFPNADALTRFEGS
ncbi:MAG: substrate-binding domain-containing protein [Polyangiaceae bacterium]|jgi:ABC-type sugar transport system substrate-binding protein